MGLLSRPVTRLDDSAILNLRTGMAEAGIGQAFIAQLNRQPCSNPVLLSVLLERISEALDQSPAPAHERRALRRILGLGLGLELLARHAGISQSSVLRHLSGSRSTPD